MFFAIITTTEYGTTGTELPPRSIGYKRYRIRPLSNETKSDFVERVTKFSLEVRSYFDNVKTVKSYSCPDSISWQIIDEDDYEDAPTLIADF